MPQNAIWTLTNDKVGWLWLTVTHSAPGFIFAFLNLRFLQPPWNCSDLLSLWHLLVSEQTTQENTILLVKYGVYFDELMNYTVDLISLNIKSVISACVWNVNQWLKKIIYNSTTDTRWNELMYNSNSIARRNISILMLWMFLNQNQVLMFDFFFFEPFYCCCR